METSFWDLGILLILAYIFFIGSVFGWVLEVFFRRFFSKKNPERRWINPGFCIGPYLPIYGCGLCIMYLIASIGDTVSAKLNQPPVLSKIILFLIMSVCMTLIEYIGGMISIKFMKVRLWDYSNEWGNIKGVICPKFSLAWAILGALYYFLIHPRILDGLIWLSNNLAFSFVIGLFFGVFIIDAVYSLHLVSKIRAFANENGIVVKYEELKHQIARSKEKTLEKARFFFPLSSARPLNEYLAEHAAAVKTEIEKLGRKRVKNK